MAYDCPVDRLEHELRLARLDDERYVEQLYRLVLRREPDPQGGADAALRLRRGLVSQATLLAELVASDEFVRVRALDDAVAGAKADRLAGERPRALTAPASLDERAIEIRWLLGRYRGERRVLDTGSAHAEPSYLSSLMQLGAAELTAVDLAPCDVPELRSVEADLRALPFADDAFELAFCLSTLEHVGADNSRYGAAGEGPDPEGPEKALAELGRVLKRGGRLLLTVPSGAHEDHGWFLQLEPDEWLALFERSGFHVVERELYLRAPTGWRSAASAETLEVSYGDIGPGASAVLCAELRAGAGPTVRERLFGLRRRLRFRNQRQSS
jgi:SAM-dependent methyltransferase